MAVTEKEMIGGCCVCSDERGWQNNKLVYCDGPDCAVAVHQVCYGIRKVPAGEWFCRKCDYEKKGVQVSGCELCPSTEGAFKPTDNEKWAHVVCALYIPEVSFGSDTTMEPVITSKVPPHRFQQYCHLCKRANEGACIKCVRSVCDKYFHVTCCQNEGLLSEEASGTSSNSVRYVGYCLDHWPYKHLRGMLAPKEAKACGMEVDFGSDDENRAADAIVPEPAPAEPVPVPPKSVPAAAKRKNSRDAPAPKPKSTPKTPKSKERKSKVVEAKKESLKKKTPTSAGKRGRKSKEPPPKASGLGSPAVFGGSIKTDSNSGLNGNATGTNIDLLSDVARTMLSMAGGPNTENATALTPTEIAFNRSKNCTPTLPLVRTNVLHRTPPITSTSSETGHVHEKEEAMDVPESPLASATQCAGESAAPTSASSNPEDLVTTTEVGTEEVRAPQPVAGTETTVTDGKSAEEVAMDTSSEKTSRSISAFASREPADVSLPVATVATAKDEEGVSMPEDTCDRSLKGNASKTASAHAAVDVCPLSSQERFAAPPEFPSSLQDLLMSQWNLGAAFLRNQSTPMNVASVLQALQDIREENTRMEERIAVLEQQRDHLVSVTTELEKPLSCQPNTPPTSPPNTSNTTATSLKVKSPVPVATKGEARVSADTSLPASSGSSTPVVSEHQSKNLNTRSAAAVSTRTRWPSTSDDKRSDREDSHYSWRERSSSDDKPSDRKDSSNSRQDQTNTDEKPSDRRDSHFSWRDQSNSDGKSSDRRDSLYGRRDQSSSSLHDRRRYSNTQNRHFPRRQYQGSTGGSSGGSAYSNHSYHTHNHHSADLSSVSLPHPAMTPASFNTTAPAPPANFPPPAPAPLPFAPAGLGMFGLPAVSPPSAHLQSPFITQIQQMHQQQQQQQGITPVNPPVAPTTQPPPVAPSLLHLQLSQPSNGSVPHQWPST